MTDPKDAFHAGERTMQARVGLAERMAEIGPKAIRDFMPDQHREFFARLPFLVAAVDVGGQPWATVLTGEPGFLDTSDARRLAVAALPAADDPAWPGFLGGARIGTLGIQFHTRRRNRLNGRIAGLGPRGFSVDVEQSFGNCPKYIQARLWYAREDGVAPGPAETRTVLSAADLELVRGADTLFVASRGAGDGASSGLDASHRGGPPGFVRVEADGRLLLADYPGNNYFNTFGNLLAEPRCGLLFLDFDGGDALQLAGRAEVLERPQAYGHLPHVVRALAFHVEAAVRRPALLPWRWSFLEYAPQLEIVEPPEPPAG